MSFDLYDFDVAPHVETKNELGYLNWPTAVRLSNRQNTEVVTFATEAGRRPFLPMLNGGVVAVDALVAAGAIESRYRTWLPIMDADNHPIPLRDITSRNVTDSIARCRVKALAMTRGLGLCLYANDTAKGFTERLGVQEDADLAGVPAVTATTPGGMPYVEWAFALAAARITDPHFGVEVQIAETGLPAFDLGNGWAVAVRVTYKGVSHTEWLPIMDGNHEPIFNPDVFDWNTAVMRCMTKAIAYTSGYGLSVYAGEKPRQEAAKETQPQNNQTADMIIFIEDALTRSGKSKEALLKWLGMKGDEAFADLPPETIERAYRVFQPKAA